MHETRHLTSFPGTARVSNSHQPPLLASSAGFKPLPWDWRADTLPTTPLSQLYMTVNMWIIYRDSKETRFRWLQNNLDEGKINETATTDAGEPGDHQANKLKGFIIIRKPTFHQALCQNADSLTSLSLSVSLVNKLVPYSLFLFSVSLYLCFYIASWPFGPHLANIYIVYNYSIFIEFSLLNNKTCNFA